MHLCHCLSCFQTQLVKYPSLWFYYDCVHKCAVMCLFLSHRMSCVCVSGLSSALEWTERWAWSENGPKVPKLLTRNEQTCYCREMMQHSRV